MSSKRLRTTSDSTDCVEHTIDTPPASSLSTPSSSVSQRTEFPLVTPILALMLSYLPITLADRNTPLAVCHQWLKASINCTTVCYDGLKWEHQRVQYNQLWRLSRHCDRVLKQNDPLVIPSRTTSSSSLPSASASSLCLSAYSLALKKHPYATHFINFPLTEIDMETLLSTHGKHIPHIQVLQVQLASYSIPLFPTLRFVNLFDSLIRPLHTSTSTVRALRTLSIKLSNDESKKGGDLSELQQCLRRMNTMMNSSVIPGEMIGIDMLMFGSGAKTCTENDSHGSSFGLTCDLCHSVVLACCDENIVSSFMASSDLITCFDCLHYEEDDDDNDDGNDDENEHPWH